MKLIRFTAILLLIILMAGCGSKNAVKEITTDGDMTGVWEGKLDVGVMTLRIVFNVKSENGVLSSTMDSPDQAVTGIDVATTSFTDSILVFDVPAIGGKFTGTVEGTVATGIWEQNGQKFDMMLSKVEKAPEISRPQNPVEPYPYKTEEVKILNKESGFHLAGTLTIPEGKGPFPAVILVSGSGKQGRDETVFGHKPFLVIADWLTRHGIAVLRYDDRGAGESEGVFKDCTTMDFASDAKAVFEYLRNLDISNDEYTGIIGHSEGGMIAPIVSADNPDVGFIVLLSGPGVTLEEVIVQQSEDISRVSGVDEDMIKKNNAVNKQIYAILKSDLNDSVAGEEIRKVLVEYRETLPDSMKEDLDDEAIDDSFKRLLTKWFRAGMRLDHTPYISRVKCPVLAINGTKDLQVNADINLTAIEKLLKDSGNEDYEIFKPEGINHALQKCETGLPSEYSGIEETVDPVILDKITEWILNESEK